MTAADMNMVVGAVAGFVVVCMFLAFMPIIFRGVISPFGCWIVCPAAFLAGVATVYCFFFESSPMMREAFREQFLLHFMAIEFLVGAYFAIAFLLISGVAKVYGAIRGASK